MKIPGKLFFTGEYAALSGKGALVATIGPGFQILNVGLPLHADSPAGKLLKKAATGLVTMAGVFRPENPWHGAGGLGASTAEFLASYVALTRRSGEIFTVEGAYAAYREIVGDAASGYDLLVQAQSLLAGKSGGELYWIDRSRPESLVLKRVECPLEDFFTAQVRVMLFLCTTVAGRKVTTHEHLATYPKEAVLRRVGELHTISKQAFEEILIGTGYGFAKALERYRAVLAELGLESVEAAADRQAFSDIPGVWTVKGSGAMLHDALIVCVDPDEYETAGPAVLALAADRGYLPLSW
jgi:hypothetical protein